MLYFLAFMLFLLQGVVFAFINYVSRFGGMVMLDVVFCS